MLHFVLRSKKIKHFFFGVFFFSKTVGWDGMGVGIEPTVGPFYVPSKVVSHNSSYACLCFYMLVFLGQISMINLLTKTIEFVIFLII